MPNGWGKGKTTKADLVSRMAKDAKITKVAAGKALDSVIDGVTKALKKGDSVTLVGFGTFSVTRKKARMGRNPQTGRGIKIPAKKVAKFKAGASLRKVVK